MGKYKCIINKGSTYRGFESPIAEIRLSEIQGRAGLNHVRECFKQYVSRTIPLIIRFSFKKQKK